MILTNSLVPFDSARLQVPLEPTTWPHDRSERVSINCFGVGGTNVHVRDSNALLSH